MSVSFSSSCSPSSSFCFLDRQQTEHDDDHEQIRKNLAASFSCSSSFSSSCSIAFHAGQTEHDDDHEHDQEIRRFFIVLVLVVVLDRSHRRANRA